MDRRIYQYKVVGRSQRQPWFATANDFILKYAGIRELDDQFVRFSAPYAIDFKGERLLNVCYSDAKEITGSTFVHDYQRRMADQLVSIPFELLPQLSKLIIGDQVSQVRPTQVFSIARAGSTLLARMFEALNLDSVSEPDVMTQFALIRSENSEAFPSSEHLGELAFHSTVLLLDACQSPRAAIKYRSQVNQIAGLMMQSLPHSEGIMLLRGLKDWVNSVHRAFGWPPSEMAKGLAQAHRAIHDCTLRGRPLSLFWYEDLRDAPLSSLERIADLIDLDRSSIDEEKLTEVMQQDAQQDSILSKQNLHQVDLPSGLLDEFAREWSKYRTQLEYDGIEIVV